MSAAGAGWLMLCMGWLLMGLSVFMLTVAFLCRKPPGRKQRAAQSLESTVPPTGIKAPG